MEKEKKKTVKNTYHNFPKPKMTSSEYLIFSTTITKPKDSSFTVVCDIEKEQIFTF